MRHITLLASISALMLIAMLLPEVSADDRRDRRNRLQPLQEDVLRFEGSSRGRLNRAGAMVILASPLQRGANARIFVPNTDPGSRQMTPPEAVSELVGTLRRGDLIEVTAFVAIDEETEQEFYILSNVKRWQPAQGEDLPNNFVFRGTRVEFIENVPVTAVVLSKMGVRQEALVPMTRTEAGHPIADPKIAEVIRGLQVGDVVTVQVAPGRQPILRTIEKWEAPRKGVFLRVAQSEDDPPRPSVVIRGEDDKELTLVIQGREAGTRWIPDPQLNATARRLRADQAVHFRFEDKDGTAMLTEISPAPPQQPQR